MTDEELDTVPTEERYSRAEIANAVRNSQLYHDKSHNNDEDERDVMERQ